MSLEGGEVRVDLRPVSSLLPHEETIESQIEKIAGELKRDGVQKDPLIVDRDSGVVLDGMHRLSALTKLGIGYTVCCTVDYSSKEITLRRWARVYGARRADLFVHALEGLGFSRAGTTAEVFDLLENRKCALAAMLEDGCYLPRVPPELERGFELVRKVDELSVAAGWQRSFVAEEEVDVPLQDSHNMVILVPRINKQDVLTAARTKHLFPCKTSMHIIDPRPVSARVQLADLKEGSRKSLDARLHSKHKLLPPNSIYEGRRYKERLLVLSEK